MNEPDIRDGEPKDERPDHAKDKLEVPVDYICANVRPYASQSTDHIRAFRTDIGELDASGGDKLEGFVDVLCFLYTHTRGSIIPAERCVS